MLKAQRQVGKPVEMQTLYLAQDSSDGNVEFLRQLAKFNNEPLHIALVDTVGAVVDNLRYSMTGRKYKPLKRSTAPLNKRNKVNGNTLLDGFLS